MGIIIDSMKAMNKKGKVYLVGAGPGRPDLITVRGLELLKYTDCVIYDKLASPALLNCVRPDAELLPVPKRAGRVQPRTESLPQRSPAWIRTGCRGRHA